MVANATLLYVSVKNKLMINSILLYAALVTGGRGGCLIVNIGAHFLLVDVAFGRSCHK